MKVDLYGVYLVDFRKNVGGEINGKHYAVVLTCPSGRDKTFLVAPITSKKANVRYRGGFTIDCTKYQTNPTHLRCFVKIRKMREIDKKRILGKQIYKLDEEDVERLKNTTSRILNLDL